MIAIFIPTYNRPHKLFDVLKNIELATKGEHRVYFIIEASDTASKAKLEEMKANYIINEGKPCYADCINTAYRKTTEPIFFTGADDLNFMPGWDTEGMKGFTEGVMVVGTNDLYNCREKHATHYLVKREYIEKQSGVIDTPNTVLYSYEHNYTDRELIETATSRGVYKYVDTSKVQHLHWSFGLSKMDDTYRKGLNTSRKDQRLFIQRQHLWKKS